MHRLDQFTRCLTIGGAILAVLILFLRLLTHFPFYDETTHVRHLWLISNGFRPGPDFFSSYPVLGYLFIVPFFKLFPESAFVLLVLRSISVFLFIVVGVLFFHHGRHATRDWVAGLFPCILLASSPTFGSFLVEYSIDPLAALGAIGAMVLFFRTPKLSYLAATSALCLLSVVLTPKYALPLFFGLMGYLSAYYIGSRQALKTIVAIVIGAAATILSVVLIYHLYDIRIIENIVTSHIMNSKLSLGNHDVSLAGAVLKYLLRTPIYCAIVSLGIAGWLVRSWHRGDFAFLGGAGIILGTILFCSIMENDLEQYQTPVYMSLALFSPFALTSFGTRFPSGTLRGIFATAVFIYAASQLPMIAREFGATSVNRRDAASPHVLKGPPAVNELADINALLGMIPRDERVVALWPHHPLFRKDLTAMVGDDRPSLSTFLDRNDPLMKVFDPVYFREALEKHPPALMDIGRLDLNYPPGWDNVAHDFMRRNQASYVQLRSNFQPEYYIFIRRDLAPGYAGDAIRFR